MSRKSGLPLIIVAVLSLWTAVGSAQTNINACPIFVQQAYTFTEAACGRVADGVACIGNGSVSTIPFSGRNLLFANPGDQANLADIQRFQTQTMTTDLKLWTSVIGRLAVSSVTGAQEYAEMLVFGDTVIWKSQPDVQATGPESTLFPATIEAGGGVIVRQDASANSSNVWQLLNGATVQAIGRSFDQQWIRILIPSPNGGTGWVFGRFVNVEGGSDRLPAQTNASPVSNLDAAPDSTSVTRQALKMESLPIADDCAEATDSGILLQSATVDRPVQLEINGVLLQFAGTVFLKAQVGGSMTVYNLEGKTVLVVDDRRTDLPEAYISEISMDASLSPIAAPSPARRFDTQASAELAFLPLQLFAREVIVVESQASAQESAVCPNAIKNAYSQTASFCQGLDPDYLCIGNIGAGMLQATASSALPVTDFSQAGDITSLGEIERLSLNVADDPQQTWSTAVLQIEADTSGGTLANATMMLLGDVELVNRGATTIAPNGQPSIQSDGIMTGLDATVQVTGSISIRAEPRVDTDAITLVDDGEAVIALESSLDQQWIKIKISDGTSGWIVARFLQVEGSFDALPVYNPDAAQGQTSPNIDEVNYASTDRYRQVFDFRSRDVFPACRDVPPSGLLIQTPTDIDDVLLMTINGANLEVTGTAYLTASNASMTLYSLEGASSFNVPGASTVMFAGEQMTVPLIGGQVDLNAVGMGKYYSDEDGLRFSSLPQELLPRSFDLFISPSAAGASVEAADSSRVNESDEAPADAELGEPPQQLDEPDAETDTAAEQCVIGAGGLARNIRRGPGTDYEVVSVLQVGQAIEGKTQKRGTYGYYWYRTERGWIRFDAGEMTSGCQRLPFHGALENEVGDGEPKVVPPLQNEFLGDVCETGGANLSATIERSGSTYHEFGGLWTGQAGASVTFTAHTPYFSEGFGNVINFTNADGSVWLGSGTGTVFTINFVVTHSFRVRVSGLLGDHVSLRVSC